MKTTNKYIKIITFLACCFALIDSYAQTNFDSTDYIANLQKQYIIRVDVANGNVYLPYKKKLVNDSTHRQNFKRTAMPQQQNPLFKIEQSSNSSKKYLLAKRMYSPKVGSMVRIVYENVPRNYDVTTNVEMTNKNLEYADMAQSYLNSQNNALKEAIKNDTTFIKNAVERTKIDSVKYKDSVNLIRDSIKLQIDTVTLKIDTLIKNTSDSLIGKLLKHADKTKDKKNNHVFEITELITELKSKLQFNNIPLDSTVKVDFQKNLSDATNSFFNEINKKITVEFLGSDEVFNIVQKSYNELKLKTDKASEKVKKRIDTIYQNLVYTADSLRRRLYLTQDSLLNYTQPITITPQPFQVFNTDITHIVYTIKKGNIDNAKTEKREILLKNKGGFKIDFSTGFIGTGLVDDNYKVVADSATAPTAKLENENKGNFSIGFGLMAHAYFRSGGRTNYALSAGLMINSSNQNVNYTTGLSIPLGLEERLILNAGIIYGKVKRLAAGYKEESSTQNRLLLNANNGNVPTIEKWDNSWYLGVSFNIGSISASNKHTVTL